MDSSTLRHIWSVIEETQTSTLLNFSDMELVQQLIRLLENRKLLNDEEISIMSAYICSTVPVVRDLAKARSARINGRWVVSRGFLRKRQSRKLLSSTYRY
jgi:hypothetical protein